MSMRPRAAQPGGRGEPGRPRWLSLLVVAATVPVLIRAQHGEFRRLQERARRTPGQWNRRLRRRTT